MRVGAGDGARADRKPGDMVAADESLALVERPRYVSRGGDKLAAALDAFGVDPRGMICLDVGASTGGFTDCLLQHGAARVYALDVGRGQLAESLRNDPRVVLLERTHAARLAPDHPQPVTLPEPIELAVIDVSFISLTRVLAAVDSQLDRGGTLIALVKPQFEVEPNLAPGGVVRELQARQAAVESVEDHARSIGLRVLGRLESPLVGPAGNREYLVHLVPS